MSPIRRGPLALFSDFDGTLSPIVPRPEAAVPAPGAVDALAGLAGAGWAVGLISGRAVEFLQGAVALPELVYVGQHGLERADGLEAPRPVPAAAELRIEAEILRGRLEPHAVHGFELEVKRYAFAFHYRNATVPDAEAVAERVVRDAARGLPFVVRDGKALWELLPDLPIDKGTALRAEIDRLDAAAVTFVGDDVGDLHAFDALDVLALNGLQVTRVAVRSPEAPPEMLRRADEVLDGPRAVVRYLSDLVP